MQDLSHEIVLVAYASGCFPMADSASADHIHWVEPIMRGIFPLSGFHIPRRLKRTIRQQPFSVSIDTDFEGTMRECARARPDRPSTWINGTILKAYSDLHRFGHAHSVECRQGDTFVGGLYGVSLGRAFFGESMVSYATDASKIALTYLVARLRIGGYELLDAQFKTPHLQQFGAVEISQIEYLEKLEKAVDASRPPADFYRLSAEASPEAILQSISQTS
ncbi:MAG: leucyl/phenylalanyl-tRNA--protein transferase [Pseudomonadota bacterium]